MKSVLFVCTGNTCRSPMAEALLRETLARRGLTGFSVASAGLAAYPGDPATPEAVAVLGELGIDHSGHRSRSWTADLLSAHDLILTMERAHKDSILRRYPDAAGKVFTLKEFASGGAEEGDIEDPLKYRYDPESDALTEYRRTRDELAEAIEGLLPRLSGLTDGEKGARA